VVLEPGLLLVLLEGEEVAAFLEDGVLDGREVGGLLLELSAEVFVWR